MEGAVFQGSKQDLDRSRIGRMSLATVAITSLLLALAGCDTSIEEPAWGDITIVASESPPGTYHLSHPDAATDLEGGVHVVWSNSLGSRAGIWGCRYDPSLGWGEPVQIANTCPVSFRGPRVAAGPNGSALAVWSEYDGSTLSVWASCFHLPTGWTCPELLQTDDAYSGGTACIGMDESGRGLAVWYQKRDIRYEVWAKPYDPDTGWGEPTRVHGNEGEDSFHPHLAMDAEGKALAVWMTGDVQNQDFDVCGTFYDPSSGWGHAQRIEDGPATSYLPRASLSTGGHAVVAWFGRSEVVSLVWARTYGPSDGWSEIRQLSTPSSQGAFNPVSAIGQSGDALVAWSETSVGILAARHSPIGGFSECSVFAAEPLECAVCPDLVMAADGVVTLAWKQDDGLWVSQWERHSGWGALQQLDSAHGGLTCYPRVVADGTGNVTVVWKGGGGGNYDIRARQLRRSGWN